jgi:DNA-binding beta-propeller fold protein YncE
MCAVAACDTDSTNSRPFDGDDLGNSASGGTTKAPIGNEIPEPELEENFRSPVVSGPYLWSANPETNRVARIDARDLEVEVIDGGHAPTFLAALSGAEGNHGAVVLNVLGGDASVFRENSGGMGGASGSAIGEVRIPVQEGASAWAVGKVGKFAIAWSRFEEDLRGPLDGYQDLTVLSLAPEQPYGTRISVGYRPTKVVMNAEETRAFVVSDPGISVLDLSGETPAIVRELFLPDGGDGQPRDVSFSSDGKLAFVKLSRRKEVLIIRTEDDSRVSVALPAEVTDLDLSGEGNVAVAVMRGKLVAGQVPVASEGGQGGVGGEGGASAGPSDSASYVALLPVPEIFDAPTDFELLFTEELVGSAVLSRDSSVALLYTSAIANTHLTMLDVDARTFRTVDLQAPAQAAFISDDGRYAAAVMTPPIGSGSSGAFALVSVEQDLPVRFAGTTTVPRFIALWGDRALVTTWGSETSPAEVFLGKFPDRSVDRIELPSEPLAAGIVPEAAQGFVAQAHPEGRVTFVDLESSLPTTVTGFELASKVVEE